MSGLDTPNCLHLVSQLQSLSRGKWLYWRLKNRVDADCGTLTGLGGYIVTTSKMKQACHTQSSNGSSKPDQICVLPKSIQIYDPSKKIGLQSWEKRPSCTPTWWTTCKERDKINYFTHTLFITGSWLSFLLGNLQSQ